MMKIRSDSTSENRGARTAGSQNFTASPATRCSGIPTLRCLFTQSGQGITEMVFLIPLFVILGVGAVSVSYMCWQGIKVQEAANVAARVAGQETVGGAKDFATMMQDNGLVTGLGVNAAGDPDPSTECDQADAVSRQTCLTNLANGNGAGSSIGTKLAGDGGGVKGVYWDFRKLIYSLFTPGEQKRLYVPTPTTRGGVSEVKVTRIMQAPKIFGWQAPPVSVSAKAYGGEDPYMYSLPRFGHTNSGGDPFWQQVFKGTGANRNPNQPSLKDPNP